MPLRLRCFAAWQNVERDLRVRTLRPTHVSWLAALRRAARIADSETPFIGTRSFDVLQVAAAKMLGATDFISFAVRQRRLAVKLGMNVLPI